MLVDEASLVRLQKKNYYQYQIDYNRYLHENKRDLLLEYYQTRMGTMLHLDHPLSYNEKLQWLKLNWRCELANRCTDKYTVREVLKEMDCEELVVPIVMVFDEAQEIDFSQLPDSFVLKPTNSSGFNLFVKNKR